MAARGPLKLLVDTNVWLDYFLARSRTHAEAAELIAAADGSERIELLTSSLSLKDLAYVLAQDMKVGARAAGAEVTPEVAAAARETAWACARFVLDASLVVPVGRDEVLRAFALRPVHDDLEDDLLLGAACRAGADYVVTHDRELARRSPVPCVDVVRAAELAREA